MDGMWDAKNNQENYGLSENLAWGAGIEEPS